MKLKRVFFIVLIVIFGVTIFMNCEKNTVTQQKEDDKVITDKPVLYNKEFANMGKAHNAVLDSVAQNCNVAIASRQERFEQAQRFTHTSTTWERAKQIGNKVVKITEFEKKPSTYIFTSKSNMFSSEFIALNDKLDNIFDVVLTKIKDKQKITPDEFNKSVDSLIDVVYKNYDVSYDVDTEMGNEFAFFIAQCFIAKASLGYWYEAATNPNHAWHKYIAKNDNSKGKVGNFFKKVGRALKVAGTDVWGFVAADNCGDAQTGYDLGCAWENAGDQSSAVK